MNMKFKKLFPALFALMMMSCIFAMLSVTSYAANESGQCGDNVYWEMDGNDNLRIYGTGDMYDYTCFEDGYIWHTDSPWYGKIINSLVVENGVTSVGDNSFRSIIIRDSVTFGDSVSRIGDYAFYNSLTRKKDSLKNYNPYFVFGITGYNNDGKAVEDYITDNNGKRYLVEYRERINAQGNPEYVIEQVPKTDSNGDVVKSGGKVVYIPKNEYTDSLGNAIYSDGVYKVPYESPYVMVKEDEYRIHYLFEYVAQKDEKGGDVKDNNGNIIYIPKSTLDDPFGRNRYNEEYRILFGYKIEADKNGNYHYVLDENGNKIVDTSAVRPAADNKDSRMTLRLPKSLKTIGRYAFYGDRRIVGIDFNSSLEEIGHFSFSNTNIFSLVFPSSLKTIGHRAFAGCNYMYGDLICGDRLELISDEAFYKCGDHVNATWRVSGNTEIMDNAFKYVVFDDSCNVDVPQSILCPAGVFENRTFYYQHLTATITVKDSNSTPSYKKTICFDCGKVFSSEKDSEHTYKMVMKRVIPATAYEDGETITQYECSDCGDTYISTQIIEAEHNYIVVKDGIEATCTAPGKTAELKCADCGFVKESETVYKEHDCTSEVLREASCFMSGAELYTCKNCGCTYEEEIAKLPHTVVIDYGFKPTCTSTGLSNGSHCDVCAEVIEPQLVRSKIAHTDKDGDGVCDVCSNTITNKKTSFLDAIRAFFQMILDLFRIKK